MTRNRTPFAQGLSALLRYGYYLISTGHPRRYARWRAEGEPNPFLKKPTPRDYATRSEITHLINAKSRPRG